MRARRVISGMVAAAGLVFSASAQAEELGTSHGLTYVREVTPVDGVVATSGRVEVDCPQGTRAIGGGGGTTALTSGSLASTSFFTEGEGWFTDAWQPEDTAFDLFGFAICADDANKVHRRTNRQKVKASDESGGSVVRCHAGRVTGGGAIMSGDPSTWQLLRRIPSKGGDQHGNGTDGWIDLAFHTPGSAETYDATIACMRGVNSLRFKQRTHRNTPGLISAIIGCPDGKVVSGGGVNGFQVGGDIHLTGSFPVDTARDADTIPDDAWELTGYDTVGGGAAEARVICI